MTTNPFLEAAQIRDELYRNPQRIIQRTSALHRAKITGPHPATVIADIAATGPTGTVLDIGCGRGTTTLALAQRLTPSRLIAFDQSAALLAATQQRLMDHPYRIDPLQGDFHAIDLPDASVTLAVAAFCLYHSPHPQDVIAQIRRCLTPGGLLIAATKSLDSYRTIDDIVATSGLDPHAMTKPSLYETFHSQNAAATIGQHLALRQVIHHDHHFQFHDADHLTAYISTNPKYQLPPHPGEIAEHIRATIGNTPVTTQSTVTYIIATRR